MCIAIDWFDSNRNLNLNLVQVFYARPYWSRLLVWIWITIKTIVCKSEYRALKIVIVCSRSLCYHLLHKNAIHNDFAASGIQAIEDQDDCTYYYLLFELIVFICFVNTHTVLWPNPFRRSAKNIALVDSFTEHRAMSQYCL